MSDQDTKVVTLAKSITFGGTIYKKGNPRVPADFPARFDTSNGQANQAAQRGELRADNDPAPAPTPPPDEQAPSASREGAAAFTGDDVLRELAARNVVVRGTGEGGTVTIADVFSTLERTRTDDDEQATGGGVPSEPPPPDVPPERGPVSAPETTGTGTASAPDVGTAGAGTGATPPPATPENPPAPAQSAPNPNAP